MTLPGVMINLNNDLVVFEITVPTTFRVWIKRLGKSVLHIQNVHTDHMILT